MGTRAPDGREQPEATPDVDDLQQEESPIPTPCVRIEGPVLAHPLPARSGPVTVFPLTTTWQKILARDLKRSKATLICTTDALAVFHISRKSGGEAAPWPINVALTITHCDEMWAKVAANTGDLTIIVEVWAD